VPAWSDPLWQQDKRDSRPFGDAVILASRDPDNLKTDGVTLLFRARGVSTLLLQESDGPLRGAAIPAPLRSGLPGAPGEPALSRFCHVRDRTLL